MRQDSVSDILFKMRCKGVRIWADNGRLRYHAPDGPLNAEETENLRARRTEILEFLQRARPSAEIGPELAPRSHSEPVPLAFSQQWWWNGFELDRRPSLRMVFEALRLSGRLSTPALRRSLTELVCRHEALRTRIVDSGEQLTQHIDPPIEPILETINLSRLSEKERGIEIRRLAEQIVNEPFWVSSGPLFAVRLLRLADREHVLVIALDHMISDAASLGILRHEMFTLYAQCVRGLPCSLAKIPIQFADYAVWQQRADPLWRQRHGPYWMQRLSGAEPIKLFADERLQSTPVVRWAMLPIEFGEVLSSTLRALSSVQRTTCVMSVLTAYVACILRVSGRTDVVVPFVTSGRLYPQVHNTIGFFGTPMLLRIELREGDSYLDLLVRVTQEYAAAYEHQDSCRMARQIPCPEVMRNPSFNWIPREFHTSHGAESHEHGLEDPLSMEQYHLDIVLRDVDWGSQLGLLISDTNDGISGGLRYRSDMFSLSTMERLLRTFRACAEALANEPKARVIAGSCEGKCAPL